VSIHGAATKMKEREHGFKIWKKIKAAVNHRVLPPMPMPLLLQLLKRRVKGHGKKGDRREEWRRKQEGKTHTVKDQRRKSQ
jgi:hypothetical protein